MVGEIPVNQDDETSGVDEDIEDSEGEEALASASRLALTTRRYFPTLTFSVDVAHHQPLNEELLNLIYAERDQDQKGIQRSNYQQLGGWHSRTNLHRSKKYSALVKEVAAAGRLVSEELEYDPAYSLRIGTLWSIINSPGSSNLAHIHPGCLWSGVYYVQVPKNSGHIVFTDPRTSNLMQRPKFTPNKKRPKSCWTKVNVRPTPGRMIIFPSWLYHAVKPNLSNKKGTAGDRVIMSFNLSQRKS